MCQIKFLTYFFIIFFRVGGSKQLEGRSPDNPVPNISEQKRKLIIDTDAGADDAVAILNILAAEELFGDVEVELITAVRGNTHVDNVAVNVLKVLKTVNRLDIPLHRGANQSLLWTPSVGNFFGEDGFGNFDFEDPPSKDLIQDEHAVKALIEATALYPGQVTLVCLGPLTNIALAIRLETNFFRNLKEIYVLGGSDSGVGNVRAGVEFNFYVDPEAALIVLNEAEKNKKTVHLLPWETAFVRSVIEMTWRKDVLGVIGSPQVNLLNKAEKLTLDGDNWISSDGMLSALVLDDSLIESAEVYHVDVEVCGQHSRAAVFVDYASSGNRTKNVNIIKRVNTDRFKKMLLENFNPRGGQANGAARI